jgi:hypothetical protein
MDKKELRFFSLRGVMILLYIFVVAVIPLALRMRLVDFHAPVETWRRLSSAATLEVFAQFRLELLVITGILIAITALLKIYYTYEKETLTNSYADYSVALFAFLIVLSALCSPYINVAFWGYPDRAEGAFAYLLYLLIFMVAANLLNAEKDKKIIFYAAVAAGLLQSVIAITQFFGFDLLKSALALRLFIPPEYAELVGDVEFVFTNKAYGTTYNPNYLGGYMAMILPMIFVRYLFARSGREMVCWLIALFVATAGFLAPTSIGAFIAVGLVLLIFFFFTAGHFRNYYPKLLCALLIFVAVTGFSEVLSGGMVSRKFSSFYNKMQDISLVTSLQEDDTGEHEPAPAPTLPEPPPRAVDTVVEGVAEGNEGETPQNSQGNDFRGRSEERIAIDGEKSSAGEEITDEKNAAGGKIANGADGKRADGEKIVLGIGRHPLDSFGSHRGYIWRKTLQMMLQDNLLLGSGPDTFVYNFPHWEPHRDHKLFRIGMLIDKPHSTYLQIGVGVGVLGLLVYLLLLGLHGYQYLRAFRLRGIQDESDIIMLALFAGWLGYLFQGLSNDSVLSNAPVFWALFGLSVNYVKNSLAGEEKFSPTAKKEVKKEIKKEVRKEAKKAAKKAAKESGKGKVKVKKTGKR